MSIIKQARIKHENHYPLQYPFIVFKGVKITRTAFYKVN